MQTYKNTHPRIALAIAGWLVIEFPTSKTLLGTARRQLRPTQFGSLLLPTLGEELLLPLSLETLSSSSETALGFLPRRMQRERAAVIQRVDSAARAPYAKRGRGRFVSELGRILDFVERAGTLRDFLRALR